MKKIQKVPPITEMDDSQVLNILHDPKRMSLIQDYNERYYHWDELKYRVDDDISESVWILMKTLRESSSTKLSVCGLDMRFNIPSALEGYLFRIDHDSAGLMGVGIHNEKDRRIYSVNSLMEEAIASSQIEGASTTRKDAKKMLRSHRKPRDIDEMMIFNNYAAMERIKDSSEQEMDIDLILDLHRTITKGTLHEGEQWEGRFREDDETVVGSTNEEELIYHIPPKHDRIQGLMQELCDFINGDDGVFIHPIVKGIIIHFLIGYIHPFVNGNGRLARSLFYWYVMKNGYWLMEYTSISRIIKNSTSKYGLAYQYSETDDCDLTYFIRFNLECIKKGVDDLRGYLESKVLEEEEMIDIIDCNPELNIKEIAVLNDYSKDRSLFSINEISERYCISYHTARNYVNHMLGLHLIRKISNDGRTVLFIVDEGMNKNRSALD